jgi:uncharacterized protein with PIN domain
VRLFVDEDTGPGIARALRAVGVPDVDYVAANRVIKKESPDEEWIRYAGESERLVLSRNTAILRAEAERLILIEARVGIVFLPQHLVARELLHLVLRSGIG